MNPMEQLRILIQKLTKEAESLGLELHQAVIVPAPVSGDPDIMQAMFLIKPQAIEKEEEVDPEQEGFDAQFEEMMRGQEKSEDVEYRKKAAEQINDWLNE